MNLRKVRTWFGPMSAYEVLSRLVATFGADDVRRAVDEIDDGKVMGCQVVVSSELGEGDWKLVAR